MNTATGYSAPIHALLVEIRELEEAGLVAVSIDEGAEFRVELTSRGYEYLVAIGDSKVNRVMPRSMCRDASG